MVMCVNKFQCLSDLVWTPCLIHSASDTERERTFYPDGLYLMEVDRVLRPEGYWVLSGPPVTSRVKSKNQKRDSKELQNQMEQLNDVLRRLCWEKIAEIYPVVIWRKPSNQFLRCRQRLQALKFPRFCSSSSDPDTAW